MSSRAGPSYFVDQKKGEVNELRALLRNVNILRDTTKLRETIKKVIAYMTLGIDVSRLFSEMVLVTSSTDLVVKKMVYLYLCNYAESNAELSLLVINTLTKDCQDSDPMVRGLALRSLCSLRLSSITEYLVQPIQSALQDPSAYVRKTAVVGVVKLYHLSPSLAKDSFVDTLYNMIQDTDPQVIVNCLNTLNEILLEEGGIVVNKAMIIHLLNRIRDFNEWGQCSVLDLLAKYDPESEDEIFTMMNLLDDRLRHANSAVVLATVKCFLRFTESMPEVHNRVLQRVKDPLLTLMAGGVELEYCVLSHIKVLTARSEGIFDDAFKQFFCKYNEPSYIRSLKLDVLYDVSNEDNAQEIIEELSEYISDSEKDVAKKTIRTIGKIAIKLPSFADRIVEQLLEFIDLNMDDVSAESISVMKDLLRKYPDRASDVLPSLQRVLGGVEDPDSKAAVVWMLGEYGEHIENSPYVLEGLINKYNEESSVNVRIALITATVKLFFKRAPEVQKMLGKLFALAIEDTSNADLQDRVLYYYRLLQQDIQRASSIVNCPKTTVETFAEEDSSEIQDRIFDEFNSLAVTYQQPSEMFIDRERLNPASSLFQFSTRRSTVASNTNYYEEQSTQTSDLLDLDEASIPVSIPKSVSELSFTLQHASIDVPTFQSKWAELGDGHNSVIQLSRLPAQDEVERHLQTTHFQCMAAGDTGTQLKFFFYARQDTNELILMEFVIDKSSKQLHMTIKLENTGIVSELVGFLTSTLSSLLG